MKLNPWCEKHWEPYKDGAGPGTIASELMWDRLINDQAFIVACGGNVKLIGPTAKKWAPICCYLGDDIMTNIHKRSLKIREKHLH